MNEDSPEHIDLQTTYLAAMREIDDGLLSMLDQVGADNDLTENEMLALAILGTWAAARDVDEGRIYISVPASAVRFYDRADRLLVGEARDDVSHADVELAAASAPSSPATDPTDADNWLIAKRALLNLRRTSSSRAAASREDGSTR